MTTTPEQQASPTKWGTFKNWHGTEALWREIYARTVSALIALTVAYLVAVLADAGATRDVLPNVLLVVGLLLGVMAWAGLLLWTALSSATVLDKRFNGRMTPARTAISLLLVALLMAVFYGGPYLVEQLLP